MPARDIYLSVSTAAKLTSCEQQYVYYKVLPPTGAEPVVATSEPLLLGTLLHRLVQAWYQGRSWRDEFAAALDDDPWHEEGFEPENYYTRAWTIMLDWEQVYGDRPDVQTLAIELPFDLPVPDVPGVRVRGFLDGVTATPMNENRTHDRIEVLEVKSMGRWGREDLVPDDPQLWTYLWACRQLFPVTGARFEAVSTYPYKEPYKPEKRFKRLELEYDQRKIDMAVENLQKVARRALSLNEQPELAIRNVSENSCRWCDYKLRCLRPWELEIR